MCKFPFVLGIKNWSLVAKETWIDLLGLQISIIETCVVVAHLFSLFSFAWKEEYLKPTSDSRSNVSF